MASNQRDVVENIIAKDSTAKGTGSSAKNFENLKKKVDDVGKSGSSMASKLKGGLSSLAAPALAIVGALGALAVQAGKSASDAQQSLGSTQAIFGKTADAMIAKSNQAATKYGLSANDYRESANLIGSLFKNQGVASDKLAAKTDAMISRGSDLAAVFGGTTADAVDALGSAFKGEFDPLEKYGISLNQATINAEAMRIAHVKNTSQFDKLTTAQQKAYKQQATGNLITKQSASATGQFTAQSSTSAEQLQIVKAKYGNLSAEIGAKLLPIFNSLLSIGGKVLDWAKKNKPTVIALAIGVGILAATVLILNAAFLANPIVLIIAGIAALVAGVIYCYGHFKTFRDVVNAVWGFMKGVGKWFGGPFVDFFTKTIPAGFKTFLKYLDEYVVAPFLDAVGTLLNAAAKAFGWVPGIGPKLKDAAKKFQTFRDDVNNALNGIKNYEKTVKVTVTGNGKELVANGKVSATFAAGQSWSPLAAYTGGTTQPAREISTVTNINSTLIMDRKVLARESQRVVDGHARRQRVGVR